MTEEWRDIKGFEDKYQVSNFGRIKSLKDKYGNYREKMLKPGNNGKDYLQVNLSLNGKVQMFKIHRLVAEAFLPNPEKLPIINHKDENKQNNCAENLEWCSAKYNCCYGTRSERISKVLSKKVACYKEGKLIKIYNSTRDTEKDGFKQPNVCKCCRGKLKSHGGFNWRYI